MRDGEREREMEGGERERETGGGERERGERGREREREKEGEKEREEREGEREKERKRGIDRETYRQIGGRGGGRAGREAIWGFFKHLFSHSACIINLGRIVDCDM